MIKSEDIIRVSKYFSKIHHIPGRIRVRVSPDIKQESSHISVGDIENLSDQIEGISSVKINKIVGSITISYDKNILTPQFWEDLLAQNSIEKNQEILNNLAKEVKI